MINEKEFNRYTDVDVPNVPSQNDVNAIIQQQYNEVSDTFTPLSDPNVELPNAVNIQPFNGDPVPFDLPGASVKKHLLGSPDEYPGGFGIPKQDDISNWIQATSRDISNSQGQYAETFMYDAGPKTNSFYKRYAAYGDDKFSEVGFHPFVDNEANFNQNTTMADDWSRMLTHSFPVLLKRGFVDGPISLGKALTGNFSGADLEDSKEYEEAAAIGQSSREGGLTGFSAFMNNTVMNFGYTAGIITEALLEEVALSLVTVGSRGMTAKVAAERTGQNGKRILNALGKFGSGFKAVSKLSKISKSPTAARSFWDSIRSAGKILNPLENTVDAFKAISSTQKAYKAGKATSYLNGLGIVSKTAGGLYRDARALNMAISESRLEAGMVENDIYKELSDDFYSENGRIPSMEEQYGMRIRAKQGSLETFYANAGIIYVTNQITFRNIVAPKGGIRNFMKGVQQELKSPKFDSKYGSLGKLVFDKSKNSVKFQKNKIKTLAKSWIKEPGLKTFKSSLGYFKANISEGIQENLQESIARANIAHYIDMYKTEGVSSSLYSQGVNGVSYQAQTGVSADRYWDELKKEWTTKQGFETFASGFMMGFMSKPLNDAVPFLSQHHNRIFDKEGYQKWVKVKAKEKVRIKNYLNDKFSKEGVEGFLNNRLFNLASQEEIGQILKFGSKKEALDAAVDSFVEQASIMTEYGAENVFIDKLESMLELTDAELADAVQSLDESQAPKYRERISSAITSIKNIKEISKTSEEILGANPIQESDIDRSEEGLKNPENIQKIFLKNAWDRSVKNYIYINAAFQDTAKRIVSIYGDYLKNTSLENIEYGAAKVLFLDKDVKNQKKILNTELETTKPNSKRSRELKKQIELLENFTNAKQKFNEVYNVNENLDVVEKEIKELYRNAGVENLEVTDEEIASQVKNKEESITLNEQEAAADKLKDAHHAYLRFLAKTNESTIFETNLDDAFNKLLDYYKLNYENRFLAESIDILTDPTGFLTLVEENAKAAVEFFSKQEDVVNEIVDKEVKNVEFDSLINDLAKIGLAFVNQEEALQFKKNKIIPKSLSSLDTGQIFSEDTPEYNVGLVLLNQFIGIQNIDSKTINPVTQEDMTESQTEVVKKLNALFALSKEYSNIPNSDNYINDVLFERVSNLVSNYIGEEFEYMGINSILLNEDSYFNDIFKKENKFSFTKKNINEFIETLFVNLQNGEISGIDLENGLKPIADELDSLINKTERTFIKQKILDATKKLKTAEDKNKSAIEKEISALQKELILEPTEENVRKVIEEIVIDVAFKNSRIRGNNLDDMVRDYFDPNIKTFSYDTYKNLITEGAFNKMFGEKGLLKELKDLQQSGELVIFSKNLTIGSKELDNDKNVAGTMDLVAVDKSGKTYIIDLKTMKSGFANEYGSNNTIGGKNYAKHSMQLLAYSNILFNETGIDAETLVLPIVTTQEGFKITSIEQPTKSSVYILSESDKLVKGKLFVDVNRKTKGENTKIVLSGAKIKTKLDTVDINDIDNIIPRNGVKAKINSKETKEFEKPYSKKGNVITLEKLESINENFIKDAFGKLIYITPGIGGKKIVDNNPNDFVYTDNIIEEILQDLGYVRKEGEKINQYLYRFARNEDKKSPLEGNRDLLNEKVLEKINEFTENGKTVITTSPSYIANVPSDSFIITTTANNSNFLNTFASEQEAVNFLSKEQSAIEGKNDQTALQINEFKELIEYNNDSLYLYRELDKKDFNYTVAEELRNMIDIKANSILNNQSEVINTSKTYTLISDLQSTDLKMGDQVNVLSIDTNNKELAIRQSKAGAVKLNIDFSLFEKSLFDEEVIETSSKKDRTNSEAVAEYLKSLENKKSEIDNNPKSFDNFSNKTDKENFDIFKCG